MTRFSGLVGYVTQEESSPGVWSPVENPRSIKGDLISHRLTHRDGDQINPDVSLSHRVSLIGDQYALDNYHNIRWIEFNGVKWKVTSVEIQRPRVIVSLGGIWNGS